VVTAPHGGAVSSPSRWVSAALDTRREKEIDMAVESRVVVGRSSGVDAARRTYLALQNSGVDAGDIKLAGESAVDAEHAGEAAEGKEQVDEAVVRRAAIHVVAGGVLGGGAGVLVGAVAGALTVLVADGAWWWMLIPVFVLGVLGAVLGAFIAAERNIGVDDQLELTLADVDGPMWIAVRVRDDASARAIGDVLAAQDVDVIEEHTARTRGFHLIEW
jgi:hypothetical protein